MRSKKSSFLHGARILMALLLCPTVLSAQQAITPACIVQDPGPRPAGNAVFYSVGDGHGNFIPDFAQPSQDGTQNSSGNVLPHRTLDQFNFWEAGLAKFGDLVSVKGTPATEPLPGLGPRFNGNSCFMCHSQPAIGGTSPGPGTPLIPPFNGNPQIALAHHRGATNSIPKIVSNRPNGPVVEARFPRAIDLNNNPVNVLDGSVKAVIHDQGTRRCPNTLQHQPATVRC